MKKQRATAVVDPSWSALADDGASTQLVRRSFSEGGRTQRKTKDLGSGYTSGHGADAFRHMDAQSHKDAS